MGCDDCHARMFANEVLHDILTEIKETKAQKIKRISRNLCDNILFGIQLAIAYPILCLLILTSPIWLVPVYLIFPPYLEGDD